MTTNDTSLNGVSGLLRLLMFPALLGMLLGCENQTNLWVVCEYDYEEMDYIWKDSPLSIAFFFLIVAGLGLAGNGVGLWEKRNISWAIILGFFIWLGILQFIPTPQGPC